METKPVVAAVVHSGSSELDTLLHGLRLGDNVVWQIDRLEDYSFFARMFAEQAIDDGLACVYLCFAGRNAILTPRPGLEIVRINPGFGFDYFTSEIHRIIEKRGTRVRYIFDSLSDLVDEWATDELVANFFRVTCPYLLQINAVAYFALRRGQHGQNTVNRIRDTTQILIDVYHIGDNTYIQPLKVSSRHSDQMFVPHLISADRWEPVSYSGDAARILTTANKRPLGVNPKSIAPWDTVYRRLVEKGEPQDDISRLTGETAALKEELSRMMIGNHKKLIQLSNRYLTLGDLLQIRNRLIGSGRIGGKAAGMLLARSVLLSDETETGFSKVLEEHDSFYIGSDVFFTFLVNNDLFLLRLELTKTGKLSRYEFAKLEQRFLKGDFPDETMEQFRGMIDYYGQAPIIVRSSSLLEDGFSDAFAGKYRSEFCANQGSPEKRLDAFLKAVKLVYASTLNPDALAYRRRRGLIEGDEQMAVLVQRVSGMPYRQYFFPSLAGVAFSRNLYAWTDRIDPQKGMIRLVFGLGTRAVNRVSGDYPRMIAVSHPNIRPEMGMEIAKYSQRMVDLLDLKENALVTKSFTEVIKNNNFPTLELLTSEIADGYLRDWFVIAPKSSGDNLILTFNNLISQTALVSVIGKILANLENAWGQPVDIEFTAHVDEENNVRVNLLQCRSLRVPTLSGVRVSTLKRLPKEQVLFRSNRAISAGVVSDIGYIIYVDPKRYSATPTDTRRHMGRAIGRITGQLRAKKSRVMAMGPGRWGSSNIELGVNVGYADIEGAAVLVEIAYEEAGHAPEVSYGTHFFQDLVESNILYLPVYPSEEAADFNTEFFSQSPNIMKELLPDLGHLEEVIRVIDVSLTTNGALAKIIADPQTRNAACFLHRSEPPNVD